MKYLAVLFFFGVSLGSPDYTVFEPYAFLMIPQSAVKYCVRYFQQEFGIGL